MSARDGTGSVGIIANPAAGKDIRRLVSAASPVSDMAKIGIIRRAVIGAVEGGATRLVLADDRQALARRAIDDAARRAIDDAARRAIDESGSGVEVEVLDLPLLSTGRDSQRAAARMAELGVGAVIVLGGDGTHRDVAKGWREATMVGISTGTNNVFPRAVEATVAGRAAGLVAAGAVDVDAVSDRAKVIVVEPDGGEPDLGLVDVALVATSFTAGRAVWEVAAIRELVTAIAEPDTVGLSAIAAALRPLDRRRPGGVHVCLAAPDEVPACTIRAPIAPGLFADVPVADHRSLDDGEAIWLEGSGVLSFDGERDVVLRSGQRAGVRIEADGPRVVDVARALAAAHAPHRDEARNGEVCHG